MNTIKKTHNPATEYCNAIGPECQQTPVAIVVTIVRPKDTTAFSDLVCRDHLTDFVERLAAGDDRVIAIKPREVVA